MWSERRTQKLKKEGKLRKYASIVVVEAIKVTLRGRGVAFGSTQPSTDGVTWPRVIKKEAASGAVLATSEPWYWAITLYNSIGKTLSLLNSIEL